MALMALIVGLLLFLGVHSTRVFASDWRSQTVARLGEKPFKGIYALLSIAGFALLTLVAFVLLAAAYVPGNQIKARWHHPMALATKVWALAHLLVNGSLGRVRILAAPGVDGCLAVWGNGLVV